MASLILIITAGLAPAAPACQAGLSSALEAAVRTTGLKVQQTEILKSRSKGFSFGEQVAVTEGAVLLGLEDFAGKYSGFAKKAGIMEWPEAYRLFGVDPGERNHTEKFLQALVRSGRPVVFLIPQNLWGLPYGMNTKREIWWMLNHPDELQNVVFVVGAYD